MAVFTISREFGSEGNYIGMKVAEALGYHLVFKKEITDVFDQYGMSSFEGLYHADISFWTQFDTMRIRMMEFLTKVIRAFAHHGNVVIVGRCSYAIVTAPGIEHTGHLWDLHPTDYCPSREYADMCSTFQVLRHKGI